MLSTVFIIRKKKSLHHSLRRPSRSDFVQLEFNDSAFLETLSDEEKAAFCEYAVIANEDTYKRYISEILPGIKMSDEKFLSELESNYAFSFDVDQIIRAADFDKPTLFLCGRQDNCVGYKDLEKLLDDYSRASFAVLV